MTTPLFATRTTYITLPVGNVKEPRELDGVTRLKPDLREKLLIRDMTPTAPVGKFYLMVVWALVVALGFTMEDFCIDMVCKADLPNLRSCV